jgi:outer membrane protein OmpA-like peptidoglycan-associated protein
MMWGMTVIWAEEGDPELQFPTTQEEIIKLLGVEPQKTLSGPRGGLKSVGNDSSLFSEQKRGLGGIVNDEEMDELLADAPKVGALVLFDFDSATIKNDSLALLEEFAKAFQNDLLKDAVFVIAGHTDNKGADAYNLKLSRRRAEAVKQVLVSQYQIEEHRLLIKAYGEEKPFVSNDTAEGRAQNRRVEFMRVQ